MTLKTKIPAKAYTKDYFLSDGYAGAKEYKEDMKRLCLSGDYLYRQIPPTECKLRALDAGCGKGEFLVFLAKKGYQVYGVDYSSVAVEMAKQTLARFKIQGEIVKADVRELPFPDNFFDLVVSLDVLEHLDGYKASLDFLKEVHRVLKPKGKLFLHTAPNRLYVDYFQRYYQRYVNWILIKLFNFFQAQSKQIPISLQVRTDYDRKFHLNEQTFFNLKRILGNSPFTKYRLEVVSDPLQFHLPKLPYYIIAHWYPLNKLFPFNILLGSHFYVTVVKP